MPLKRQREAAQTQLQTSRKQESKQKRDGILGRGRTPKRSARVNGWAPETKAFERQLKSSREVELSMSLRDSGAGSEHHGQVQSGNRQTKTSVSSDKWMLRELSNGKILENGASSAHGIFQIKDRIFEQKPADKREGRFRAEKRTDREQQDWRSSRGQRTGWIHPAFQDLARHRSSPHSQQVLAHGLNDSLTAGGLLLFHGDHAASNGNDDKVGKAMGRQPDKTQSTVGGSQMSTTQLLALYNGSNQTLALESPSSQEESEHDEGSASEKGSAGWLGPPHPVHRRATTDMEAVSLSLFNICFQHRCQIYCAVSLANGGPLQPHSYEVRSGIECSIHT